MRYESDTNKYTHLPEPSQSVATDGLPLSDG